MFALLDRRAATWSSVAARISVQLAPTQRAAYCFFGALGRGLCLSATVWGPGCEPDTGVRFATGCSEPCELDWPVRGCVARCFSWALGATVLPEAPS